MRIRLVFLLAALLATLALAGCGSSSSPGPAGVAPPGSPLFIEATVQPQGTLKSNVESLAKGIAGIDDLGGLIVSKLESTASGSGERFDFDKEVQPWLGEKAGLFFERYDGSNFSRYGFAVQSTDTGATQDFIDKQVKSSPEPVRGASYEGVDYKVEGSDGTSIGVVGSFLVIAEDEQVFKDAVDASKGESLADVGAYSSVAAAKPAESLADAYVDIGSLIRQSGSAVSAQALQLLKSVGIEPSQATVLASLLPGSSRVEINVSAKLGGKKPPSGNASGLLGSFPASSFAGLAVSDFGKQLQEAINSIDATGIPPNVPPHKLKSTMQQAGINLDQIAGSLDDAGVFAEGASKGSLGGALVLSTKEPSEASGTVASVGLLLRHAGVPGVTAISGKSSGFSVHSPELSKPLAVLAEGNRIAIGYGLPAALQGLSAQSNQSLSGAASYKEAVAALGSTPISGFIDGPAALQLAESLVPRSDSGFKEAEPYLAKIGYVALGTGSSGELATAKLIVGLSK